MNIKKRARQALYQGAMICDNPYTYGLGDFEEDRKWKEWHQEFLRLREEQENIMKLSIKGSNHPALKSTAKEVIEGTNAGELIDSMWELMYASKGVGLAANQVGVLDRVIVVHANGFKQELINPLITKSYGGRTLNKEGCLSFPGVQSKMLRSKQIIVEGFDRNWKPVKRKLKGLAAYCVQHEVDHLDGKTIVTEQAR